MKKTIAPKKSGKAKKTPQRKQNSSHTALIILGAVFFLVLTIVLVAKPILAKDREKQSLVTVVKQRIARVVGQVSSSNDTTKALYEEEDDLDPSLWQGGIAPYPDAPGCTDHSDTQFHTIWNKEKGCHYDHTHGYDPDKTMFKDVVASWTQEISYPWQTTNENQYKHKGYVYLYTEAQNGCETGRYKDAQGCIRKFLIQLHSIGTNMEVTTRFHSFRFVAEVCNLQQTECGIVQGGGHTDYGVTHCPYKKDACPKASDPKPLPSDGGVLPELVTLQQPPYVANGILPEKDRILFSGRNTQFWNGFAPNPIVANYYPEKPNQLLGVAWSSLDGWTLLNPDDGKDGMYDEHFICQDGMCKFNHSEFRVYSMKIAIPQFGDSTSPKFTNRFGQLDTNCKTAGDTCVPLLVSNSVPTTIESFYLDRQVNPKYAPELEFDICFNPSTQKPEGCNSKNSVTSGWITPQDTSGMPMKM